jgi:uncharacterized protein YqhQ
MTAVIKALGSTALFLIIVVLVALAFLLGKIVILIFPVLLISLILFAAMHNFDEDPEQEE